MRRSGLQTTDCGIEPFTVQACRRADAPSQSGVDPVAPVMTTCRSTSGPLSVMLLNLKTGRVAGYDEGQAPLIYLTTTIAVVRDAGCRSRFF